MDKNLNEHLTNYAYSLAGKIVKVDKTRGNVPRGVVGTVIDYGGTNINIDRWGDYKIEKETDVIPIETENIHRPIVIGTEVTVCRDYTNIKKGSKIIVKDFLDEKQTKIIADGILPGGWIDKKSVSVPIDIANLRFKTLEEMVRDYSYDFLRITNSPNSIIPYLGKPITEKHIIQTSFGFEIKIPGGGKVQPLSLTNKEIPKNLSFFVIQSGDLKKLFNMFDGNNSHWLILKELAGKKLLDLPDIKTGSSDDKVASYLLSVLRSGGLVYKGIMLQGQYIEVKEI